MGLTIVSVPWTSMRCSPHSLHVWWCRWRWWLKKKKKQFGIWWKKNQNPEFLYICWERIEWNSSRSIIDWEDWKRERSRKGRSVEESPLWFDFCSTWANPVLSNFFVFFHSLLGYYLLRLFAETGRFPCFSLVRLIMLARLLYLTNE